MPSYDFKCDECGYTATIVRSIKSDDSVDCATCKTRMRKLFNASAVHFKGSGWGSKPQLWTTNQNGQVEKYKGDLKQGEKGAAKPKYS